MDQAVVEDVMDEEAVVSFVVSIIIMSSFEPSSSLHCLQTDGGQIRVGG